MLGTSIASLEIKDNDLLALTADGELWKWGVQDSCNYDEILVCKLRTNNRAQLEDVGQNADFYIANQGANSQP